MIELHLSVADLASTRFALSPLWEVTASVRVLRAPDEHALHRRWVGAVRDRLRRIDLRLLRDLVPASGGLPAFLAPPPSTSTPDIATELAAMRSLGHERIRSGLDMLATTPAIERFREDPDAGLARLAAVVEAYWEAALAPWWPRIRTLCEHDLRYRAALLAEGGARRLFADLSPHLAWDGAGTLRIDTPGWTIDQALGGRGLLLVPTVFGGDRVHSVVAEPWQPTIRYRPRGLGMLWRAETPQATAGLAGVLGATRASLLAALGEPADTGDLADRCGISPGGASQQLQLLLKAGLVTRHRAGRRVLYARTVTAEALLEAAR
ncbi:DUF5937 family protein [Glycomyces scopariae]